MRLQTVAAVTFAPDALFFWDALHSGDTEAEGCFAPLQYGVALKWLRKFLVNLGLGAELSSSYTLRSAKATLLSYGRDDVWLPLSGQKTLRRALLLGWRPTAPQHRGGQLPLQEPKLCLPAFEEVGDFPQCFRLRLLRCLRNLWTQLACLLLRCLGRLLPLQNPRSLS